MPVKRLTHHQFGFSVAVAGSDIEKGNAGVDRLAYRSDCFVAGGWAPNLSGAATTKSKAAYLTQFSERSFFHRYYPSNSRGRSACSLFSSLQHIRTEPPGASPARIIAEPVRQNILLDHCPTSWQKSRVNARSQEEN